MQPVAAVAGECGSQVDENPEQTARNLPTLPLPQSAPATAMGASFLQRLLGGFLSPGIWSNPKQSSLFIDGAKAVWPSQIRHLSGPWEATERGAQLTVGRGSCSGSSPRAGVGGRTLRISLP